MLRQAVSTHVKQHLKAPACAHAQPKLVKEYHNILLYTSVNTTFLTILGDVLCSERLPMRLSDESLSGTYFTFLTSRSGLRQLRAAWL